MVRLGIFAVAVVFLSSCGGCGGGGTDTLGQQCTYTCGESSCDDSCVSGLQCAYKGALTEDTPIKGVCTQACAPGSGCPSGCVCWGFGVQGQNGGCLCGSCAIDADCGAGCSCINGDCNCRNVADGG